MDFLFQVCVRNQGHIQARYAYCIYTLLLGVGSGRPWSEEILPLHCPWSSVSKITAIIIPIPIGTYTTLWTVAVCFYLCFSRRKV